MINQDHQLEFPGGLYGFELVSRFCNNNGIMKITVSNVSLLHCCSIFLGMHNLLKQTELFLQNMFYWSWNDIIICLKSCETFVVYADSYGLLQQLICALQLHLKPPSSSNASPETGFSSSSESTNAWWFDDLAVLCPKIIEKIMKSLGAYGTDNNSLILTRFLLHYLRRSKGLGTTNTSDYSGLADTAVERVISVGKSALFSCRKLLGLLRLVSGFGVSKDCRACLEKRIGEMLDRATLDDLMVSGHHEHRGVYDVNLVLRLIRIFVNNDHMLNLQRVKKVGRLIDKYLGEIAPDQNLKVSKFVGVAESLPDFARDCFDGVYRAIDIYLQSHPRLSLEERSKICRCLNYKKLSLEACKELAKNPKIPPKITVEALMSQPYIQSSNENIRLRKRVVELGKECSDDIKAPQMLHLLNASPITLFSSFPTSFC